MVCQRPYSALSPRSESFLLPALCTGPGDCQRVHRRFQVQPQAKYLVQLFNRLQRAAAPQVGYKIHHVPALLASKAPEALVVQMKGRGLFSMEGTQAPAIAIRIQSIVPGRVHDVHPVLHCLKQIGIIRRGPHRRSRLESCRFLHCHCQTAAPEAFSLLDSAQA